MGRHKITCATKDSDGDVQTIGNTATTWSRTQAVELLNAGTDTFYVQVAGTTPTEIKVYAKYFLRTEADGQPQNNLDNLAACTA